MRNLTILGEKRRCVKVDSSRSRSSIVDLCHVPNDDNDDHHHGGGEDEDDVAVLLTSNGLLVKTASSTNINNNDTENNTTLWTCDLNEFGPKEEDDSSPPHNWFDATYVDAIDSIVCLSYSGAILVVSPSTGQAELVGEFEHGLETGKWSPDGEILVLVTMTDNEDGGTTKNSVLLTMNGQWEVLAEVTLERHVSAKEKNPKDDQDPPPTAGKLDVSVCWRPDGTLMAVSAVDATDQIRRIRTYQRDTLELQNVGRSEDGSGKIVPNILSTGIAWASGGCSHLLTGVQRKSKKTTQIIFFEPNGLRHREFAIRTSSSSNIKVKGLFWNVGSDLVAVLFQDVSSSSTPQDKIQLWHRCNYHWYMKQELCYKEGMEVSCAKFHEEQPYVLFVGLSSLSSSSSSSDLTWSEMEFRWDPSTVGYSISPTMANTCTAISVDGCILNVTPLGKALVPPPMYAANLSLDCPIQHVTFASPSSSGSPSISFVVQTSNGMLTLFQNGGGGPSNLIAKFDTPSIVSKVGDWRNNTDDEVDVRSLRNLLVMKEVPTLENKAMLLHLVAIACANANQECERLVEIVVEWECGSQDATATIANTILLEGRVLNLVAWSDLNDDGGALVQLVDGTLLEYSPSEEDADVGGGSVLPSDAEPLLEPCPWLAALKDVSSFDNGAGHRTRLVVGMTHQSRLYCHDRLLADAASSFVLSLPHKFLCYATADAHCKLRFLPLSELVNFDPFMGSDENHMLEGYEPRNVERGTRLVAVLPKHPDAILQMPRGNMEGVYPRALVLPYVMSKIEIGEYGRALTVMRRQKVDLNLIVDLNPTHFLETGVWSFLDQVKKIDYLNLFIATLQDINITQWKYQVPEWFRPRANVDEEEELTPSSDFDYTTKVNQVCQMLRHIMIQAERDGQTKGGRTILDGHFLLPILSTFAKENPPQLEAALSLIQTNAISNQPSGGRKPPLFSEKAQSSIQYLAFLANYELLFDTALGMYDYDLARAVARNSQMDPKVYLPLLKRLKSLPEIYARYEVDLRLKRYESALSNLAKSGEQNESLEGASPAADDDIIFGNGLEQCMSLIEQHKLHRLGLELFGDQSASRERIMKSLGNRLLEERRPKTALSVFLATEPKDIEGAKRAARSSGDWRSFFTLSMEQADSEDSKAEIALAAADIAEELSNGMKGNYAKRDRYAFAARILLDYCDDVISAVDMFISAQMWSESRRVACLHSRQDLMKKSIDSAMSYAQICLSEFEDQAVAFKKANKRYAEVIRIRKDAVRDGDALPGDLVHDAADETGSLFSMASAASNTSLASNLSGSSMGSVASTSSVISVSATSTFSLTGAEHDIKHKSKFNKLGRDKKKKKKKKKSGKKKLKPGSPEELNFVIGNMKENCIFDEARDVIAETIEFLSQVGKLAFARELFDGYNQLKGEIASSQKERIEKSIAEQEEAERIARREGQKDHEKIVLPVEAEVNALHCGDLPVAIQDLFSFL